MRADNSRHLTTAARQRAEQTRARAVRALRRLDETGKSITFEAVAAEAGVSRSWLYSQQDIRAEIQALRTRRQPSPAAPLTPQRQRATEASLLRSLEATSQRMRHLEEDNRQLRQALAEALGAARTAQTTGKDEPTRPSGERSLPAHHDAVVLALGGGQQQGRVDDTVHKTNTQVNPLTGPTPEDNVGSFWANAAWLTLAAMAHNIGRALATLAGHGLDRATLATLRRTLLAVPGRLVHSARRWQLRLPVSYTHLRAHETPEQLVCRLLLEKKK